jgi:hypothetical protein
VLPNYFYNNLHQIVQTQDSVLILTEMVHDARRGPDEQRAPAEDDPKVDGRFDRHWEGDTLVVDTTNFTDKTRYPRVHAGPAHRRAFHARRSEDAAVPVHDRGSRHLDEAVDGEYTWPATDEQLYEYACHEGNYAMGNILRGARLKEATTRRKPSSSEVCDAD